MGESPSGARARSPSIPHPHAEPLRAPESACVFASSDSGLSFRYRNRYGATRFSPSASALSQSTSGFRSVILFFCRNRYFRSVCFASGVRSTMAFSFRSSDDSRVMPASDLDVADLVAVEVQRRQLRELGQRRQVADLVLRQVERREGGHVLERIDLGDLVARQVQVLQLGQAGQRRDVG